MSCAKRVCVCACVCVRVWMSQAWEGFISCLSWFTRPEPLGGLQAAKSCMWQKWLCSQNVKVAWWWWALVTVCASEPPPPLGPRPCDGRWHTARRGSSLAVTLTDIWFGGLTNSMWHDDTGNITRWCNLLYASVVTLLTPPAAGPCTHRARAPPCGQTLKCSWCWAALEDGDALKQKE